MLKRIIKVSGLAITVAVGMAAAAEAKTMTFCTENQEQPPYIMGDTAEIEADKPGVSIEMVQMAAAKIGVEAAFVRQPWKRCLDSLTTGAVDGVFNGSFKKERMEFGQYPMLNGEVDPARRLTTMSYALYRLKGSGEGWDGETFTISGKVGAPLGYSIVGDLKKKGLDVEESPSTELDFKKLKGNRIAVVAAQTVTGDTLMARPEFSDVERVEPPLVAKPYYVLLSHQFVKADEKLANDFWAALADIRENDMNDLAAKY